MHSAVIAATHEPARRPQTSCRSRIFPKSLTPTDFLSSLRVKRTLTRPSWILIARGELRVLSRIKLRRSSLTCKFAVWPRRKRLSCLFEDRPKLTFKNCTAGEIGGGSGGFVEDLTREELENKPVEQRGGRTNCLFQAFLHNGQIDP